MVLFRHRFGEIGPCAKHCGDFKTAESTHVQPRNFSKRSTPGSVDFQVCWTLEHSFGGTQRRSMLEIVALEQLYSRLWNTHRRSPFLFSFSSLQSCTWSAPGSASTQVFLISTIKSRAQFQTTPYPLPLRGRVTLTAKWGSLLSDGECKYSSKLWDKLPSLWPKQEMP